MKHKKFYHDPQSLQLKKGEMTVKILYSDRERKNAELRQKFESSGQTELPVSGFFLEPSPGEEEHLVL
jgi:hypothetical protein